MPSDGQRRADRAAHLSGRAYRSLLFLLPEVFRRDYGPDMALAFEDLCREELGRGGLAGLFLLWLRALVDLSASALAERSGSFVPSSSRVCRWGGAAAVAGGLLMVASGIVRPTVGPGGPGGLNIPPDVMYVLALLSGTGSLLVFGGLFGLVRLVGWRGMVGASGAEAPGAEAPGTGHPRWSKVAATCGLVLVILAASASALGMVWILADGGRIAVVPGSSSAALALGVVLGFFRTFVVPLALVLLGVAVWRSGTLGRWRALPVVVGVLTSPLVPLAIGAAVYLAVTYGGSEPYGWSAFMSALDASRRNNLLTSFLLTRVPDVVAGSGWVLLGLVLFTGRGEDEMLEQGSSPPRAG